MPAADARPVPRKNAAYRFYFANRRPSDSTLITTWTGADSEVSLDGGSYTDCTNEATEIGTSGTGFIDLTASEMNADAVVLKITFTNSGAVPLVYVLYPEESGDYRLDNDTVSNAILARNVSNVETTMPEHCLGTVVLALLEHTISGTTLTIRRTDGATTHATKTLTTNAGADPITGIQ